MKILKKFWPLLLAIILLVATYLYYNNVYLVEQQRYENEKAQLKMLITSLQNSIAENSKYADVQDRLEGATEEINSSREKLYTHFPVEMKEEDQIMYVLYLESLFRTEISFAFSTPEAIAILSDGAQLQGLQLTVNYETSYRGFQNMIKYLSTDSRITSVKDATLQYDAANDKAIGEVTVILYLIDSENREYLPPDVTKPNTGKDNIFK